MNTNDFLVHFIRRLFNGFEESLTGLSEASLYHVAHPTTNHIAWNAWHLIRTVDNVTNFVCQDRKPPVWVRQGLAGQWRLPANAQGTGMDVAEAHALRLPGLDAFLQYLRNVREDVLPYFQSVPEAQLQQMRKLNPWGEAATIQHIGQTIIAHGYQHLGMITTLRSLQGLRGDEF